MTDWVEPLCELFAKETDAYLRLLDLEKKKREAIHGVDGKALLQLVQESYHLMVEASELERLRMKSIEEIYSKQPLPKDGEPITLSNFMNQMDRDSNFQLKSATHALKKTVQELKENILLNEKLLKNRKQFLEHTIHSLQEETKEKVYSNPRQTARRNSSRQSSIMLNASV